MSMQNKKILQLLSKGSCYNTELNKIAFRYGARLHEMKKEGLKVIVEYVEKGLYLYTATRIPKKLLKKYNI